MSSYVNKCSQCGMMFPASFENSRFCSVPCAEKAYKRLTAMAQYAATGNTWLLPYRKPPTLLVSKNPDVWARAKNEWSSQFPTNLFLWGDEGTGKTSLCCKLLCWRVEDHFSVKQVTCLDMELHLKYAYDPEKRPRQEINELCKVSCLLIDDLSAPEWTPRGLSLLRYILDRRHQPGSDLETFCTSNLNPKDLGHLYDDIGGDGSGVQMLRRLQPVESVQMVGSSYRKEMKGDFNAEARRLEGAEGAEKVEGVLV